MTRVPWVAGFVLATVVSLGSGPASQTKGTSAPKTSTQTTPQAAAPKSPGPMFVMLRITEVKPDMVSDYIAIQKSDIMPNLKKAGVEWRDAWRAAEVGSASTFATITPLKSLGDLDGGAPLEKSMGQNAYRSLVEKISKTLTASRVCILRTRPDLGYQNEGAPSDTPPKLGVLADVEVAPGRQPDFEALLKAEWVPGLKKANVQSYHVSEVAWGGTVGQFYTFTPIANFAQLEKGHPVLQSLGEVAFNRLMTKMGTNVRHVERTIIRYDEELSYRMPSKPRTESQE